MRAPVAKLESRDVVVVLRCVRDEAGMAEAFRHVEHRELGAGVRALPAADEPCPLAPGRQIHERGELGHEGAVADGPVGFDGLFPVLFLEQQQGFSHLVVYLVADRVLDIRLDEAADEGMARPGRVGSQEDVVADEARIDGRFVIDNTALIIDAALVEASGGILTKLMADAMNRSIRNITICGFGTGDRAIASASGATSATHLWSRSGSLSRHRNPCCARSVCARRVSHSSARSCRPRTHRPHL